MSSAVFDAKNPTAAVKTIRAAAVRDAEQRSQPPRTLLAPDRAELIAAHEAARREADATPAGRSRAQWRYANVPRTCSTTPLEKLERGECLLEGGRRRALTRARTVNLEDLKSNQRHEGRVLVCRIASGPCKLAYGCHGPVSSCMLSTRSRNFPGHASDHRGPHWTSVSAPSSPVCMQTEQNLTVRGSRSRACP